MAVQSRHDSSLQLSLTSTAQPSGSLPVTAGPPSADDSAPPPLPVFDLLSEDPLPPLESLPGTCPTGGTARAADPRHAGPIQAGSPPAAAPSKGAFWFDGEVLMCGCPDCGAPMTVRIWLMVADCWRCGASIELSEEQEREVRRLLKQREDEQRGALEPALPAPAGASPSAQQEPPAPSAPEEGGQPPRPRPARKLAPAATTRTRRRIQQILGSRTATAQLRELFKLTPAWLVSLVFHFLLLTLLALLTLHERDNGPMITLSTSVDKDVRPGGEVQIVDPRDEVKFDLPLPGNLDVTNKRVREALIRADQDARQLRLDPDDPPEPQMPDLQLVKQQIVSETGPRRAFAARDPRVRVEIVKQEGGTTLTEAAVARGLRWLSRHQSSDGGWSLHAFRRAPGCSCGNPGTEKNDSAATSLALLPFLGAGQTHLTGRYKDTVARGLRWLIDHQARDGYLRANYKDDPGMYAQGQGTIVLCEAYAMEGDENLRAPAQKAVDFIVASQYTDGGWRYSPRQRRSGMNSQGDTSVIGWQLMALQSARAAGLEVPEETLILAGQYLDGVEYRPRLFDSAGLSGRYCYLRGRKYSPVMTAEALLCRMYLGWSKNNPRLAEGIDWLADENLPTRGEPNVYYWYYATQVMHHWGGPQWHTWNLIMRTILVSSQETRGHRAGSWSPYDKKTGRRYKWGSAGGRLYVTALATCTLEVYYRHLPLFKQIDLD